MEKKRIIFVLVVSLMISFQSYSQEYEVDQNKVTGIFEIEGKDKSEIFSAINKWISINYNSANNVIQMNDKESGTIIVKGKNTVGYETNLTFEKSNFFPDNFYIIFNHLIEVNVQDNRFRIIYTILDVDDSFCKPSGKWAFYVYSGLYKTSSIKCVNLKGVTENCISDYNEALEKYLNGIWTNKKNLDIMLSATESIFSEMNEKIKSDIYLTMESIKTSVMSDKKHGW